VKNDRRQLHKKTSSNDDYIVVDVGSRTGRGRPRCVDDHARAAVRPVDGRLLERTDWPRRGRRDGARQRSTVGSSRGQTDRGAVGAMALGGGGWSVVGPPTHDRRRAAAADEATDGAAMDLVLRSRRRIARNIRP